MSSAQNKYDVDVAIIGAGSAGMTAYREAKKYTNKIALIDGGGLGTTCATVGCMPSKLLIAAADAAHISQEAKIFGVNNASTEIDGRAVMQRVKSERDRFVGFVLEAVDSFDKKHLIREFATFKDDHTLELSSGRLLTAKTFVLAVGSRPNIPKVFEAAGDKLIINDDVFGWDDLPKSVAVFGAGVIGLELGQALSRLGVRIRLFGRDHGIGPLSDPAIKDYAAKTFASLYPAHWHADTQISRNGDNVVVAWNDEQGSGSEEFDYLLAATGRRSNLDKLGLENTSVGARASFMDDYHALSTRIGDSHIFVAGDATSDLPLLHEAIDEGRLAGENAARFPHSYKRARRTPLGVAFSDPQIGLAGQSYQQLKEAGVAFQIGEVSFEGQGRSRVMNVNKGLLHVYGEENTGRLLGAELIGPAAEHLMHLIAWSIQSGQTVSDVLLNPFYHPVIEEGLRSALRDLNSQLGFGPNPPLHCIDCGPGA